MCERNSIARGQEIAKRFIQNFSDFLQTLIEAAHLASKVTLHPHKRTSLLLSPSQIHALQIHSAQVPRSKKWVHF